MALRPLRPGQARLTFRLDAPGSESPGLAALLAVVPASQADANRHASRGRLLSLLGLADPDPSHGPRGWANQPARGPPACLDPSQDPSAPLCSWCDRPATRLEPAGVGTGPSCADHAPGTRGGA